MANIVPLPAVDRRQGDRRLRPRRQVCTVRQLFCGSHAARLAHLRPANLAGTHHTSHSHQGCAGADHLHARLHGELLLRHDPAGGQGLGRRSRRSSHQVPAHVQGGRAGLAGGAGCQLQLRARKEPRALHQCV